MSEEEAVLVYVPLTEEQWATLGNGQSVRIEVAEGEDMWTGEKDTIATTIIIRPPKSLR